MRAIYIFVVMAILSHIARAQDGQVTTTVETYYDYWTQRDAEGHIAQLYAPVTLALGDIVDGEGVTGTVRSAFLWAENTSAEAQGEYSTWSDTVVGVEYKTSVEDRLLVATRLDINLPSGSASLAGRAKNVLFDRDFVEQPRYGEGVNILPSLTVSTSPVSDLILTGAVSHNWRGAYTPDADFPDSYKPARQLTAYLSGQYSTEQDVYALSLTHQREGKSELAGEDYFDPGDTWTVGGNFDTQWANSALSLSASWSRATRNMYLDFFTGAFLVEEVRGTGDVISAEARYRTTFHDIGMGLFVDYLRRAENDYDALNDLFIPKREKVRIGVPFVFEYDDFDVSADVAYQWIRDDPTPYVPQDRDYDGASIRVSISRSDDL
jgi:hypothetical protein